MYTNDDALNLVKLHQNNDTDEFVEKAKELLPNLDSEVLLLLDMVIDKTLEEVGELIVQMAENTVVH